VVRGFNAFAAHRISSSFVIPTIPRLMPRIPEETDGKRLAHQPPATCPHAAVNFRSMDLQSASVTCQTA
jgi:hypothetical protein